MISYLGPMSNLDDLAVGCRFDPVLGSRVWTYAHCYGARFLFCDVWVIYGAGRRVEGAISRYNGTMTISASDRVDPEELAAFCLTTAAVEFEAEESLLDRMTPHIPPDVPFRRESSAEMRWSGGAVPPLSHPVDAHPPLRQVHGLLCQCFEGFHDYSPFPSWYVDVSARVRRDICQIYTVYSDDRADQPTATAGVYYRQTGQGVIGCVGTLPDQRHKGYARTGVHACVAGLLEAGDIPYLITANDGLVPFYQKMGFTISGRRGAILLTAQ